jgi:hypothetical protein
MTKHMQVECRECGEKKDVRAMYKYELYPHPWDEKPIIAYFCKQAKWAKKDRRYHWLESCEDLLTDSSWSDFRYFECDGCGRWVCEQNPDNGWMTQVRELGDGEIRFCLQCYQEHLLANGVDRDDVEDGKLSGMFMNSTELVGAGFERDDDFYYFHVRGRDDAKRVCKKAIELMDKGFIILFEYNSMSIMGDEGYITMWAHQKGSEE